MNSSPFGPKGTLALILFLAGGIAAQSSAAYQKHEHEALSTLALVVALESIRGEVGAGLEDGVRVRFLQCSTDTKKRKLLCRNGKSQCVPFGLLTRAVDKVLRPEGLIPARRLHLDGFTIEAPERCDEPQSPTTATVKQALEEISDPSQLFSFASCRAERKAENVWTWFMAVHRNASHFESCAAAKYNALHRLAIELAAEAGKTGEGAESQFVALVAEAVALHFLQDSFAPGHLLTPRSGSTDILARGMHHLHNRLGAPVFVNAAEPWGDLEDALKRVLQDDQQLPTVAAAVEALSLSPGSILAPRPDCRQRLSTESPSSGPCYFGDGRLPGTRQAVDLVLLSAASIREVLLAGKSKAPLQIVFQEWSARPQDDGETLEKDTL